jgi:hypothetical protein
MVPHLRRIGVISDTHGLLRPEAVAALAGVELILHAGDIGTPDILAALRNIAPVTAVRGNNDQGAWAATLPETALVEVDALRLYILHDLKLLHVDPVAAGFAAVICGHSHRPRLEKRQGILFVNPGSAGPRRFKLPVAVARLSLQGGQLHGELIELRV